ncbi:hypothetical protein ANCCAN_15560 [Ancylostoma caninum]|uniref:Nose resistant-to-fluoxetine protein N-terminal domain-containing protein n=1 Tax=Ancylostoma caninum TaxID=29170 RepID=A0A368G5F4_ANCCA|nr:hypothetical protein ANCCAN_15560 [Ancylostoma caninum]
MPCCRTISKATMVFAVVLLSIPAQLLACSTLPPGQEARVGFMVQDLYSIPVQFATTAVRDQFPLFATNAADATKNVQKAVKKALMQVIKEEANRAGIGHLAADIAQQIKPTVRYTPVNCFKVNNQGAGAAANPNDFECKVDNDAITTVKSNAQDVPVPANYREFMVNLLISNYVIGGWGRDRWQLTLMKTEKLLRKDKTYGASFKTASVELLYP